MPTQQTASIISAIKTFGKENLEEILHQLLNGVQLLGGGDRCRLYLEDLTVGALTCVGVTTGEPRQLQQNAYAINDKRLLVPRTYQQKEEQAIVDFSKYPNDQPNPEVFIVGSAYLLPILQRGRAIGVLCLDNEQANALPSEDNLDSIRHLLSSTAATLDGARKYHQQLRLARRVDAAKKREAARLMVKSAAQLVEQVALASVLVPVESSVEGQRTLQILATYSKEPEAGKLYAEERQITLSPGGSLPASYIDDRGMIADESLLQPLYIDNLANKTMQKRFLTEELGLKSLYMVPRYDPRTRRIICLVNYYTKGERRFNSFERDLLEAHAEMAQRVVQEIGDEHLEVQILSEIGELLHESGDNLKSFLHRVLSKATQLIGADTGSIALVRELDGEQWLVVEDPQGNLIGAKNKDWLKRNLPPFRIGGIALPPEQRSLTGLAASTRQPEIIDNCHQADRHKHFYQPVTEAIRSEIAVPVIVNDEVVAVICLDSLRSHYFTAEHKRILLIIERMIGHHLTILQKLEQLNSEVGRLRQDVGYRDPSITSYRLGNIIGNSAKTQQIISTIQRISQPLCQRISQWRKTSSPKQGDPLGLPSILLTGETGAGKEFIFNNLFAQLSQTYRELLPDQAPLPLKKTNIAAYSGELTYSELFGHKRGAFTGAHTDRRGILEEAHGGVVFLDEIGDADPKTQVQLLRFLDSGEFVRLGENTTRHSQVLLVAGTNRDLRQLIRDGKFREDLYYRLSELIINVPSLNERREDIPDLAVHFLGRLFQAYYETDPTNTNTPLLSEGAKKVLQQHHYTGNIRELRSILLRAMLFRRSRVIHSEELIQALLSGDTGTQTTSSKSEADADTTIDKIIHAIKSSEQNFWEAIYTPYSQQEITKATVLKLVEHARSEGATNMPKLARYFAACDPSAKKPEETKRFYRFKNFLYKTVGI
jgi:transcriptional regulator with GAF, ATPase, and Fis domain